MRHAGDVDMLNFNFVALININVDKHIVFFRNIILHSDVDRSVFESFFVKITLNDNLSTIDHILRNLPADSQADALF